MVGPLGVVDPPAVGVGSVGSVVALTTCSQRPLTRFLLVVSLEPGLCLGPVVAESVGAERLDRYIGATKLERPDRLERLGLEEATL